MTVPESNESYYPARDDNIHVVGYFNGMFCLTSRVGSSQEIFLWNPITSDSTKLPRHKHKIRACGFGYYESNDEYKVFATFHQIGTVYSSKSGWRIIGDCGFVNLHGHGSFSKGALHWFIKRKYMQSKDPTLDIIVSLDIKTETYRETLPLKEEAARKHNYTTLDTFGGCLSIMYCFQNHAEVWVMKECGVEKPWTKVFTITLEFSCYYWIKPLYILSVVT